jgi:hypothetical protein
LIGETKVEAVGNGVLTVSDKVAPGGALEHWREVSPFVWQRVNGLERLSAVVKDGKVQALGFEGAPFEVFQPAAGAYAPWNRILLASSLAVLTVTVLLWPISALVRRHYGQAFKLIGISAKLYRLVRLVAVVDIILAAGWVVIFALFVRDITILNDSLDPWLRLLQVFGVLAFVGGAIGLLNLFQVWRDNSRRGLAKLTSAILAFAMLGMAWLVVALRLVTVSLQY